MERKILIADDHSLLRRSIRSICRSAGYDAPQEVQSCRELLKVLASNDFTHLILDITLEDGSSLSLLPTIFDKYILLKVVIYSSQPELLHSNSLWRRFGVQYISKAESEPETVKRLLEFLKDLKAKTNHPSDTGANPFSELALREKDVLHYLLQGWSPTKIADALDLSAPTVRVLKKRILKKTDTKNVVELSNLATKYQL